MSDKKPTHREREPHELDSRDFGVMGITVYRGCIVSKLVGGYSIFGQKVSKASDVDLAIENAGKAIEGSIRVINNDNFACINSPDATNNHDLGTDGTHVWEM
jgi:hypothetical protein